MSQKIEKKAEIRWIDVGKALAILAVLTDHLHGILYASDELQQVSFFSVTLFVLLMGVTSFLSFDKSESPPGKKVVSRLLKIIVPYLFAVFVYCCVRYHFFSWEKFVNHVICFNVSSPHYYVLLYIQLVLISPVVYHLINRMDQFIPGPGWAGEIILGIIIALISRFTNLYTNLADIYAGRLLGGSYLLCLYLGMLFGKHYRSFTLIRNRVKSMISVCASAAFLAMMIQIFRKGLFLDKNELLGSVINPPGVTLLVYALFLMVSLCGWDQLISEKESKIRFLLSQFSRLGRQTLGIFLYHRLFLDHLLVPYLLKINSYIRLPLFYLVMIFGSLAVEFVCGKIKSFVIYSYSTRSVK